MQDKQAKISIYADTADLESMQKLHQEQGIKGFTTNPSLMRAAGVTDYLSHIRNLCEQLPDCSLSCEVLADEHTAMLKQAQAINACGDNIYVKIPIINCQGESSAPVIRELDQQGIACNITVVFTPEQVSQLVSQLNPEQAHILSVFAGRIADSGRDPLPYIEQIRQLLQQHGKHKIKLLWASTRERYNILQAANAGCDIITVPPKLIASSQQAADDLQTISLRSVQQFKKDADAAGFAFPQ